METERCNRCGLYADDYKKFYTEKGKYMGLQKNVTYKEMESWIRSGNYVIIGKKKIEDVKDIPKGFK